ncbi:hypothetical protein U9M48_017634 [Paspalum notatum var. saurae]|uniref:Uncharacterized protein n=1 Tax=Paspalum notatum var. saurae TaxID=547442 RepID=A0AAQ3TBT9_PASNO
MATPSVDGRSTTGKHSTSSGRLSLPFCSGNQAVFSLTTKDGFGVLHCAASQGHLEVCRYLVEELGGDPNITADGGLTPVMTTAQIDDAPAVRLLSTTYAHGSYVAEEQASAPHTFAPLFLSPLTPLPRQHLATRSPMSAHHGASFLLVGSANPQLPPLHLIGFASYLLTVDMLLLFGTSNQAKRKREEKYRIKRKETRLIDVLPLKWQHPLHIIPEATRLFSLAVENCTSIRYASVALAIHIVTIYTGSLQLQATKYSKVLVNNWLTKLQLEGLADTFGVYNFTEVAESTTRAKGVGSYAGRKHAPVTA